MTIKRTARGTRDFMLKPARRSVLNLNTFFVDFSMASSKAKINDGNTAKIATKLQRTPLAKTTPMSAPILNFMNTKATRPTMVVKALLTIDRDAFLSALVIAVILSLFFAAFSCL